MLWALRQPKPAPKAVTFGNRLVQNHTGTVSQTVSENSAGVMKNSGELAQIVVDFTGDFAILLALHRMLQVAARQTPPPIICE